MSEAKDNIPEESKPVTPEEEAAIAELKSRFSPEEIANVPELRFLMFVRGYWNEKDRAEATFKVLEKTLAFRKEINADALLNRKLAKEEHYIKLWPYDYHHTDKRGHLIYYERTAFADPSSLFSAFSEKEIQECHVQMQEVLLWLKQKKSEELGVRTYKSVVIMDLQDFGFKHLSTSFYGPMKAIMTIDQYYYPETLYKLLIINAPLSFRTLWAVVKPWLHPLTQARIQILGGPKDYLPKLREFCDDASIPRYIGGGCSCCTSDPIDKQIDRIYKRNVQWREQRLAECQPVEKKEESTE